MMATAVLINEVHVLMDAQTPGEHALVIPALWVFLFLLGLSAVKVGGGSSHRAWCEALVQRDAEFLNPADPAWAQPDSDTLQALNQRFGRRFKVVSFRWLNEEDL